VSVLLSAHLPLLATAPEGIQKLRGLILELAVRGKLVPQDPNDEPASELLKRIAKERAQLDGSTTRKKIDKTPLSGGDEWPFELPKGWEWEQFGEIAVIERGGSPRPIKSFLTDDPDGLNWIKIGDTDKGGKYITSTSEKIRREGLTKTRMVYPGDFLLTNSMSFGRPYITQIKGCIHDGWLRISPPKSLDKDYLYTLLSSPFVRKLFVAAAAGAVVMNLNAEKVRELPIPLPPLAEQHRIVAQVDELMALCDRLEAEQTDAGAAHARLVDTLLGTLTQITDAADLATNWQRLAEHFDTLFTTEASLDALKQTILQLAVMGKLVPQDPKDEPASELLRRIATERTRLEAEGTCKKFKSVPPVSDDEQPFPLPNGWMWERIGNYVLQTDYGLSEITFEATEGVPILKMGDIQMGEVLLGNQKKVPATTEGLPFLLLESNDLLYNRTNSAELVGKTGIFRGQPLQYSFASYLIRIRCAKELVSANFLNLAMNTPLFRETEISPHLKQQCGQANVNGTILRNMKVPVPPAAEQHRIVAKVDEMMALVDRLNADLAESRAQQERLATTLIETALKAA